MEKSYDKVKKNESFLDSTINRISGLIEISKTVISFSDFSEKNGGIKRDAVENIPFYKLDLEFQKILKSIVAPENIT